MKRNGNGKGNGKDKKLTPLKILGFAALALAVSAVVWFFVNVM